MKGGSKDFNNVILDLMGDRMQYQVLDFLYENYRFNRAVVQRFDNILKEHNVELDTSRGYKEWRIKKPLTPEEKLKKISSIIDNRLDVNVVPKWSDNNELFIEEIVGYRYALQQLKKKLIREGLWEEYE